MLPKPAHCSAVRCLGRINFINPAFHNEKNFWPVGYAAERTAATPASGRKPVKHLCEVLEHPTDGGPLFRCGCSSSAIRSMPRSSLQSPDREFSKLSGPLIHGPVKHPVNRPVT